MRLVVEHRTKYTYSAPVRFVVQSLKLTPSEMEGQQVVHWRVWADECQVDAVFTDGYGDQVSTLTCPDPRSEIEIVVEGEVNTRDTAGVLRGHRERAPVQVFLRSTEMTLPDEAISALAEGVASRSEDTAGNALQLAHDLSAAIADAIEYAPGTTHAHTTAAEALAEGKGVCQDHAHVLIAAARQLGIPARYVSGYLFADAGGNPHEAAHGWAELYLDGLGWVGFDPSNRTCPTENYIRLGAGLDARDAAPIKGVHTGASEETLDVTVVVQQAQQQ